MPLLFRVLGGFDADNALFVSVDTGQQVSRLLFDCGDGCPHSLTAGDLLSINHLFFSHFHIDHIAGFDHFFRLNFDRQEPALNVWVPPGGTEIMHHRFRGFEWNLVGPQQRGTWDVHEVDEAVVRTTRFYTREGFRTPHPHGESPRGAVILQGNGYTVEALRLDHGCVSLGYVVRETTRVNVDPLKVAAKGLTTGPWLKRLRGPIAAPGETLLIHGVPHSVAELQTQLLTTTPGEAIAYLTDFRLNSATLDFLVEQLRGVQTVVCESQYRRQDVMLAEEARHSTAFEAATLAARAGVEKLILFHISPRYLLGGLDDLLAEARAVFPNTSFPDGWTS